MSELTVYATTSDGSVYGVSTVYATAHDAASGTPRSASDDTFYIQNTKSGSNYYPERAFLYFDTSDLPEGFIISAAVLSLYIPTVHQTDANHSDIYVVEGVQADPYDAADYGDHLSKTTSGGSIAYASITTGQYNDITLNATGRGWIIDGLTKLCLRTKGDIDASTPTDVNDIYVYSADKGTIYRPKLVITYTAPTSPTVTTQDASDVDAISCTGNGNITDTGGINCTRRGFCYKVGTSGDPTTADSVVYDDGSFGTGAYTKAITALTPESHYRVRAYAVNVAGTGYGTTVQVDTLAASIPTVTTQAASSVESTTATGNGNITDKGNANCTRRGFCYKVGTSGDPTTADSVAYDDGSFGTGAYTKGLTGLSEGTNYRVRAYAVNIAGTGYGDTVQILTKPAAPTGVSATDGVHTDKVVLTWTKPAGVLTGNKIYRDDVLIDTIGDVETYNDTGADAPTITKGTAAASDGTSKTIVALSLSGQSTNNGTTHTYKIKAYNTTGDSVDSVTDTGYRGVGALTYQWQISAADSDADYSDITGATTASYNYASAPAYPAGRYYHCVLAATGAAGQTTDADRGYLKSPYQLRNQVDIVIKNPDGETLHYLTDAWGIGTDYRINELGTLTFSIPPDSPARTDLVFPNEAWLYKDNVLNDIFIITDRVKKREKIIELNYTCKQLGFILTKSIVISYTETKTVTNIITDLLSLQETAIITLGGVSPLLDEAIAFSSAKKNIWDSLKALRDIVGGYLYTDFDPADPSVRRVWLWESLGEAKGQQIRIGKNLINIMHETDYIEYFNKLYPIGNSDLMLDSKTYTRADVTKSADASYGYLTIGGLYSTYKGWTGLGDALPGTITIEKPSGSWAACTEPYTLGSGWWFTGAVWRCWCAPNYSWTSYLTASIAATTSTQIRVYLADIYLRYIIVEIQYGGDWHQVYGLDYADAGWFTISFSQQNVTGIRIKYYNPASITYLAECGGLQVWNNTGWTDVTSLWEQGADGRKVRCAIADYDAVKPYVMTYTHEQYLIDLDDIVDDEIYSTSLEFDTDNVDTLLSQGRTKYPEIKIPMVSMSIDSIDLSVEEEREFEVIELGSTVSIIDEDLVISESAQIVRISKPDLQNSPERVIREISNKVKDLLDLI